MINKKNYKVIILLLLPLLSILISCKEEILQSTEYGNVDDYIIYEKILQYQFSETNYFIILRDTTRGEYLDTFQIRNIYERISALSEETLADYILKKDVKIKLKNIPNIKSVGLSSEINSELKNSVDVWLSNIGYDKSLSQAVVSMGEIYSPEAANGILFFLMKEEGGWKIKNIYGLWIS